jgi:hypothetical protein
VKNPILSEKDMTAPYLRDTVFAGAAAE